MGAGTSIPSQTDTPQVLNFILQEMFRRTDLADIYSLADPDRCKRYVIVASNALESLFVKMRVYPDKKEDGTLYLQSIDGILKSMPADVRAKQREYCVELAFFFIRIFQIFGALFLSIYDSRLPLTDPSDDIKRDGVAKGVAFLDPKDFLGFSTPPQQQSSSWFGKGGELNAVRDGSFYINNAPYSVLNYNLIKPSGGQGDKSPMKFDGGFSFLLDQNSLYDFSDIGQRVLKINPQPILYYYFDRSSRNYTLQATLLIEPQGGGLRQRYRITLKDFSAVDDWGIDTSKVNSVRINPEIIEESIPGTAPKSVGENYSKTRGQTIPAVLKAMFEKAITMALGEPPFSVAKFLKKQRYIPGDNDKNQNILGSHVYLLRNQENDSTVKIVYKDKIKVEGIDNAKDITISAKMTITKPQRNSNMSIGVTYRVQLDFASSDVNPAEYRSILSIPSGIKYMNFKGDSEDSTPSSDVNDLSIPEYLERIFKEITSSTYTDSIKGLKITRAGLVEPYNSQQIDESLKVKKLWAAMAKDPPVKSHCIARAVQLLSLEAIKGNLKPQAYSSICRLSFGYQKDGSLPTPGKPVVEESGIYALSLLFFEGLVAGSPKIIDPASYKEYLRYLKFLFERYPDINMIKDMAIVPGQVPKADAIPSRLGDIREKSLKMCEDRGDSRLVVPAPLANDLRSVTSLLVSQQQEHFKKAINIVFSIFDKNSIERDKKLKFNPRIVSGGMPEINRIANETRTLLLNYYKGCELTYRDGLLMIYNYEKTTGKRLDSATVDQIRSGEIPTSTPRP